MQSPWVILLSAARNSRVCLRRRLLMTIPAMAAALSANGQADQQRRDRRRGVDKRGDDPRCPAQRKNRAAERKAGRAGEHDKRPVAAQLEKIWSAEHRVLATKSREN